MCSELQPPEPTQARLGRRWRWQWWLGTISIVFAALLLAAKGSSAQPLDASSGGVSLTAKPGTCIVLHKGQRCSQIQTLTWTVPDDRRYCLHAQFEPGPVACWRNRQLASVKHMYSETDSAWYELREADSSAALARVRVHTSWVYRTGRRSASGWRLF